MAMEGVQVTVPRAAPDELRRARATVVRWVVRPGWGICAAVLVASAAGWRLPPSAEYAPLLVSVLLFGLPHGALDLWIVPRMRGERVRLRPALLLGVAYLALALLYLAVWFVAPLAAFLFFLAITWFHWGQGDLHALLGPIGAPHLRPGPRRALTVFVRGGMPMLVPLLAFPEVYLRAGGDLVALFGASTAAIEPWLLSPTIRGAVGAAFVAAVAGSLALGYPRGRAGDARWQWDALEAGLLLAFFAVVPPVLAIGVYFSVWHSPRHIARLAVLDPPSRAALADGRVGVPLGRFARDAAPLTAGALLLLVLLLPVLPHPPVGIAGSGALYLVLLSLLTLPHLIVVTWMDLRQGIWRGRGTRGGVVAQTLHSPPAPLPGAAPHR